MTRLHKSTGCWLVVAAGFGLAACESQVSQATDMSTPVVKVSPGDLELAVTYRIAPGRSLVLASKDIEGVDPQESSSGDLTLRINAGSVSRDTTLTIARLRPDKTPKGVVGAAYFLSPEVTRLDKPMRITIKVGELPSGIATGSLRLARLDTEDAYYQPTNGQAVVDEGGLRFVGGETVTFGVFGVVNTAAITIHTDVPPTDLWRGLHLLDLGQVPLARGAFAAARNADPSPPAAFGLALTRLLSLPGLPSLQNLFVSCGEPDWNEAAVFGETGYFAQDLARGRGTSDLEVGQGFDLANILVTPMTPTRVTAERPETGLCLDPESRAALPPNYLVLRTVDPNFDGQGTTLNVTLVLDPDKPLTDSAESLASLAAAATDLVVELPLDKLNGRVDVQRGVIDNTTQIKQPTVTGGTTPETIGLFRPRLSSPGAIRIRKAGLAAGEILEIEFAQVLLDPQWTTDRPEMMKLDGWVSAVVSSPPGLESIPLLRPDFSLAQLFERCDSAMLPAIDDAYVLGLAVEMTGEVQAISALLSEAVTGEDGADFRFDVPLGLLNRPGVVRVGPTEVHLLAGILDVAVAGLQIVAGYRLFEGDLRDAVVTGSVLKTECPDPCTPNTNCSTTLEEASIFDARLMAASLSARLLTRSLGAGDLRPAQSSLLAAVDELSAALASSAFDTVVNFQNDAILDGTDSLAAALDELRACVGAHELMDGSRFTLLQNAFVYLDSFFGSPPTADDLRFAAEIGATEPVCELLATGSQLCTLDPPPLPPESPTIPVTAKVVCNTTPLHYADSAPGCRGTLSPSLESVCADASVNDLSTNVAGWLLEGMLKLYSKSSDGVACADSQECGNVAAVACTDNVCVYPKSAVDLEAIQAMMPSTGRPQFILWRNVGELQTALGVQF
jgi:hypothetical protein